MVAIANDFTTVMDTKTLLNCSCVGQQDNCRGMGKTAKGTGDQWVKQETGIGRSRDA